MTVPPPQHIAIAAGTLTPGSDVHVMLTMPDASTATARGFFVGLLRPRSCSAARHRGVLYRPRMRHER